MKKLIYILIFLVIGALFLSCATTMPVKTIHDEFDNYTIHRMQKNLLGAKNWLSVTFVFLNAQKFIQGSTIEYDLIVEYQDYEGNYYVQDSSFIDYRLLVYDFSWI